MGLRGPGLQQIRPATTGPGAVEQQDAGSANAAYSIRNGAGRCPLQPACQPAWLPPLMPTEGGHCHRRHTHTRTHTRRRGHWAPCRGGLWVRGRRKAALHLLLLLLCRGLPEGRVLVHGPPCSPQSSALRPGDCTGSVPRSWRRAWRKDHQAPASIMTRPATGRQGRTMANDGSSRANPRGSEAGRPASASCPGADGGLLAVVWGRLAQAQDMYRESNLVRKFGHFPTTPPGRESGRSGSKSNQHLQMLKHFVPKSAYIGPESTQIGPISASLGPSSTEVDPESPEFDSFRAQSFRSLTKSAGQVWPGIGQIGAAFGRIRSEIGKF